VQVSHLKLNGSSSKQIQYSLQLDDRRREKPLLYEQLSLNLPFKSKQLTEPLLKTQKGDIIGQDPGLKKSIADLILFAVTDHPMIISGETGVGKELAAIGVHENSPRKNKPFIVANIAGIPDTLIENELFGHRKGAYTGADKDSAGLFEAAEGGTIFLDEISAISMQTQVKLLRILETKELTLLGETKPRKIDVRFIFATNESLETLVGGGKFRADLFHRINVGRVTVPPLRDRRDDIPLLVDYFLKKNGVLQDMKLDTDTLYLLRLYDWPGNVRELENVVKAASALGKERGARGINEELRKKLAEIKKKELEGETGDLNILLEKAASVAQSKGIPLRVGVDTFLRKNIKRALQIAGTTLGAAKILKEKEPTLRNMIIRLRIKVTRTPNHRKIIGVTQEDETSADTTSNQTGTPPE